MTALSIEQRARRRTSKKNNALRRTMPLFADELQPYGAMADWLTSVEAEQVNLKAIQQRTTRFFDELRAADTEREKLETELRNQAIANKTPAEIAFLDSRRSIYPKDPSYGVNFWRKVVSQYDWIAQEQQHMAEWRRKGEAWRAKLQAGDAVICKNKSALSGTHITP